MSGIMLGRIATRNYHIPEFVNFNFRKYRKHGNSDNMNVNFVTLCYLWSRDGSMPVDEKTEEYLLAQLHCLDWPKDIVYSDPERAAMAERIALKFKPTPTRRQKGMLWFSGGRKGGRKDCT